MFLGTAGVGKTSFKRSLMKLPWEPNTTSTVVSDISSIRPFTHKWHTHDKGQWRIVKHEDEIEELAQLISAVHFESDSIASESEPKSSFHHSFLAKFGKPFRSLFKRLSGEDNDTSGEDNEATHRINEIISEAVSLIKAGQLRYRLSSSSPPQPYLNFWDCGGQPPFLEILPAFLTSRTLFLLIFDAEKDLNTNWQSVVHIEGMRIEQEEVKVTTLDYMLNWMSNIHSHLMTYDEDGGVCEYPRMYCIGTHGDHLTKKKKSKVKSELEEHLKGKAYSNLVEYIKIVDNTSSGKGIYFEDPSVMVLRDAVLDFTEKKLILKTPLSWVLFRKVLQVLSNEYNVINLDKACIVGDASKISKEDIPHVLTFYHSLGVLLFYPQLDGLKDKIIINPKYFVDALGKVLPLSISDGGRYSEEWRLFHKFGILVQPLYVQVWKEFKDLKPEFFIEVLVHFRLAVEVETNKYPPLSKQYFMPLVLASASNDDITSMTSSTASFQAAPLHITFSSGYVPPGFFTRLVAVVAKCPKTELYLDKGVYRNRVTFRYQDPVSHSIEHMVVTDHNNAIQVFVDRLVPGSITFTMICQDILALIENATQEVLDILEKCGAQPTNEKCTKYKVKHKFQYVCTKCPPAPLPHYIITAPTDQTQESHVCCNIVNSQYRPLTDQEKVWFKDSIQLVSIYYCCIAKIYSFVLHRQQIKQGNSSSTIMYNIIFGG